MPGVVIGRFQEHKLHDGHKWLIMNTLCRHFDVLIIVGCRKTDKRNPLPFNFVKDMIYDSFPTTGCGRLAIIPQEDIDGDDEEWYRQVEAKIDKYPDSEGTKLYASRDSTIIKYHGKYSPVVAIDPIVGISASTIRDEISKTCTSNEDFRAGVIWAVMNILKKGE
jgi:nicotinamide mononucleotide adenylyltransferase